MNTTKYPNLQNISNTQQTGEYSIKDAIQRALTNYFAQLGEQKPTDVYDMVLSEVELPLLQSVMAYTRNNQSKAAEVLNISRGTLRKLLKKYGFID